MADNVGYTPGTGATVAADDIAGVLHQRVKVEFGADGAATDVSATDPLPVLLVSSGNIAGISPGAGLYVVLTDNAGNTIASYSGNTEADAVAHTGLDRAILAASFGFVFNGTTWDRLRGDTLGVHVSRSATAATASVTSVSASVTSVTLLALNAARKGATIVNDSSSLLYVKLGTTASTTSYTVVLAGAAAAPFAYYELPFGYTGRIDGIWASATGNARITELT